MTKKQEILIAVAILLALLALLAWIFLAGPAAVTPQPAPVLPTGTTPTAGGQTPSVPVAPTPSAPMAPAGATIVARLFVERLGSYSSEANYANIDDVLPMTTATLRAQLQGEAVAARSRPASGGFYGVSTRVISMTSVSSSPEQEVVRITTQREESLGSPADTALRYQDITVTLVQESDVWKVSNYQWAE